MEKQQISGLTAGASAELIAILKDVKLAPFKNKDGKYLAARISDKTGDIDVKLWDGGEAAIQNLNVKDLVTVRGKVDSFNGTLSITANSIEPYDGVVDPRDFLPCYEGNIDELLTKLDETIASITNEELHKITDNILNDDEIGKKYRVAPAAIALHGAYLYGLLEHTVKSVELAEVIAKLYPEIDRDLLVTGVLLHDIGKIMEYNYDMTIDQTLDGGLIGHIVMGDRLINERAKELGLSHEMTLKLSHLILSHHGVPEFGTAIYPKTLEAIALHCIDYTEAKLTRIVATVSKLEDNTWSDFDRYDNHKWIKI